MAASGKSRSFDTRRRTVGLRLGRYLLGPRLGAGGTASVYLARSVSPEDQGKLVALKVIHDHLLEEKDFVRSFMDEANLAVRMSHPNVVRVYEFAREGDTMFLAMEYLHGQPLSQLCERVVERRDRLPFDLVAWIGARVAQGLHHAHQLRGDDGQPLHLVHRDVSPQNVFITYDGQVRLIDFGIARAAGRLAKTTIGRIKGKFSYMAPEQVLGRDFDHRVDVFALGATLYETALGTRLFAGHDETDTLQKILFEEIPDPAVRAPDMPAPLVNVIRRALAAEPSARYPDAATLAAELDAYLAQRKVRDAQALLAQVMMRFFERDQAERAKTITDLTQAGTFEENRATLPPLGVPNARHTDPGPTTTAPPAAFAPRRWRRMAVAAGASVLLAVTTVGVATLQKSRAGVPVAPPGASALSSVTIDVNVRPPVEAIITVGGRLVEERPARVSVERGAAALPIAVTATGFVPARVDAIPDRDQLIVVQLVESSPVASATNSAASKVGAGGTNKPPSAGASTRRPPVQPPPRSTTTGSLITEYPD
ncbi:MAG: protein kinase [Polyangiaceae bacterium]|nr:protein kinase [Polyangiaceae bacterium]